MTAKFVNYVPNKSVGITQCHLNNNKQPRGKTAHQKKRETSGEKEKSRFRSGLRKPWTAEEQRREDAFIQECTEALKRQAERDRMLNKEKPVLWTPVLKIPSSNDNNNVGRRFARNRPYSKRGP